MVEDSTDVNIKVVPAEHKLKQLNIEALNRNEDRILNEIFNVYHVRALVVGSSGSGKTTWTLNYCFNRCIENLPNNYGLIIYCAPTETLESGLVRSIIEDPNGVSKKFGLHQDLNKYFFTLDIRKDKLPTITDLQNIQRKCKKRIALILDDFINVLTDDNEKKQIDAYLTQSSRASCDIFLLAQAYNRIKASIATNVNVLVLFLKYMSKDSYNTCLRRSFTGEISKEMQETIFQDLKHTNNHEPFIFINDQPSDRSIRYMNNYLYEV